MMRHAAIGAAALLLAALPAPAAAEAYGEAFVAAFADACVPQRLSYPGTKAQAESLGWTPIERTAHPELDAMMAVMDRETAKAAEEMDGKFALALYGKSVADQPHVLIVAHSDFEMDFGSDEEPPDRWSYVGCYLYNFDAEAPIAPDPVTALIGKPISREVTDNGMTGYLWGPPCPMPRTGDTYMTFIAEGSPHAATTGFTGLGLKFETSEPDPGEVVPETYC